MGYALATIKNRMAAQGKGQGMVDTRVGGAVQFGSAAAAARHPARREGNLPLEQVAFVTDNDRQGIVHAFLSANNGVMEPSSGNRSSRRSPGGFLPVAFKTDLETYMMPFGKSFRTSRTA